MAALCLAACSSSPRPIHPEPDERDPRFVAAHDLARAGLHEEARKQFRALRQESPTAREAFVAEVDLTRETADVEAMRQELERLSADASDPRIKAFHRALIARLPLMVIEREAICAEAIRLDPESGLAHLTMAEVLLERGDDEAARKHLETAASAADSPPAAKRRYAETLIESREYDKAEIWLRRYVADVPDDATALYNLGTIHLEYTKRYDDAYRFLERAYRLDPNDLSTAFNLATAAIHRGEDDQAFELLSRAKRLMPKDPEVYFNLAVYYADARNDPRAAIANFETYLRLGGEETLRVNRWLRELRQKVDGE